MLTATRLIELERHYGGRVEIGDYVGGDRMEGHGYAEAYAAEINAFRAKHGEPETVVEIGVLRGTGLAIWADVFPDAEVLGLDREWGPFLEYQRGARPLDRVHTLTFDQATATTERVGELLERFPAPSIVIDDASHIDDLTLRTLDAFLPHMADHFLYFVEDQPRASDIHRKLARDPRGLECRRVHRSLTVLER